MVLKTGRSSLREGWSMCWGRYFRSGFQDPPSYALRPHSIPRTLNTPRAVFISLSLCHVPHCALNDRRSSAPALSSNLRLPPKTGSSPPWPGWCPGQCASKAHQGTSLRQRSHLPKKWVESMLFSVGNDIRWFGIDIRDLCACVGHPVFDSNHKAGRRK